MHARTRVRMYSYTVFRPLLWEGPESARVANIFIFFRTAGAGGVCGVLRAGAAGAHRPALLLRGAAAGGPVPQAQQQRRARGQ